MTFPDYPISGGLSGGGTSSFDQDHFLALLQKVVPPWYLDPLLATPESGYELLQAFAKVAERVSLAIFRMETGALVTVADEGASATCVVSFTRTSSGPACTILAGTFVSTSHNGRRYRVQQNVAFTNTDNGPHTVDVIAEAVGYEYNVPGPITAANGEVLPGDIDTIDFPMLSPAYGDTTFAVAQITDAIGGAAAYLNGVGNDRGIAREPGEGTEPYRLRVRSLPDVVTPAAIVRAIHRVLDPLGINFDFIETFEHRYQEEYDCPSPNIGTPTYQATPPTNPDFNSNLFCLDDPRPLTLARYADLSLCDCDYRGAFVIVIQAATILSYGFALDDPGMTPSDFRNPTTGRQRGTPAPDVPFNADLSIDYPAAYDGPDVGFDGVSAALYRLILQIKAAGIFPAIVRVYP